MSSELDPTRAAAIAQSRVLAYYQAITVLMLVAIGILVVYAIRLGPLVGPGVEESFGLSVALMFLCAGMLIHLVDRTYRVWPEGRRVQAPVPGFVTDQGIALSLKVLVIALVGLGIAWVIASLVS